MTLRRNTVALLSGAALLVAAPLSACSSDSNPDTDASASASVSSPSDASESSAEPSSPFESPSSSEPLKDSEGNIMQMTGPGTQLAFGEPAVLQMTSSEGAAWIGKIAVTSMENPGPQEYELHGLDPESATLYYVRYEAEMLQSAGPESVLITPHRLHPDFREGSEVQYNVTSVGGCTAEDAYMKNPGDKVVGCLLFEQTAGDKPDTVVAVPQGAVPFAEWSASGE